MLAGSLANRKLPRTVTRDSIVATQQLLDTSVGTISLGTSTPLSGNEIYLDYGVLDMARSPSHGSVWNRDQVGRT